MAKSEMIRARVEPDLKRKAEGVLKTLGISPTAAITLFYKQVSLHRGLPFPVRIPNAETREAMRQARAGENLSQWTDTVALAAAAERPEKG
ncbi:MAG: type II toxin-antitoxin system RelB/DinJ family antitoxin [Rhodospirillales bacterium]